jgi:transposase
MRYSAEFKREALRRAGEEGMTDVQVCEDLGVSTRQLRRWRDELRAHGEKAFPGHGKSHDQELTQLRREFAKVKQERDFLKEAVAYFAKESK